MSYKLFPSEEIYKETMSSLDTLRDIYERIYQKQESLTFEQLLQYRKTCALLRSSISRPLERFKHNIYVKNPPVGLCGKLGKKVYVRFPKQEKVKKEYLTVFAQDKQYIEDTDRWWNGGKITKTEVLVIPEGTVCVFSRWADSYGDTVVVMIPNPAGGKVNLTTSLHINDLVWTTTSEEREKAVGAQFTRVSRKKGDNLQVIQHLGNLKQVAGGENDSVD